VSGERVATCREQKRRRSTASCDKTRERGEPGDGLCLHAENKRRDLRGKRQDPWREANDPHRVTLERMPTLRTKAVARKGICNRVTARSGGGAPAGATQGSGPEASPEKAMRQGA
jgi:hypothetical protein